MRITFIVPVFYPYSYGVSNATFGFASFLHKKGYNVSVITPRWKDNLKIYEKINNIEIYRLDFLRFKGLANLSFIVKAIKKIKEINPDIIYGQTLYPSGIVSAVAGKLYKKLSIVHARGADVNEYLEKTWIKKLFSIFSLKYNKIVFALSEDHRKMINKHVKCPVIILPNGIQKIRLNKTKKQCMKEVGFNSNKFNILWVGIIRPFKGLSYLFEAVKNLDGCMLYIVGASISSKYILKEELSKNIIFCGNVSREKVFTYMKSADLAVYPDLRAQGLGNAILEAMYMKLPIIGTKTGYFPELIKNSFNGILVSPENVAELRKAILFMKNNQTIRKKYAENSFKLVRERYNWDVIVKKFENIIKKI